MPVIISDMQKEFFDRVGGMFIVFIIIAIVMFILFFLFVYWLISGRRKRMGPIENVKEGEKSKYFSGYAKEKKNTKKEKQIQRKRSKSTKVCKTCGNFIPKDVEICSFCGSIEF